MGISDEDIEMISEQVTEILGDGSDSFEFGGWKATVLKADERYVQEIQLNQAV